MPSLCTVKLSEDSLTSPVNTLPVSLSRVKCAAYTRHKNLGVTCHPPSAASTTSLGDTQTQWSTALGPAPSTGGKIHSGNFTLHRADRDTDISTDLLLLELQVGQCSITVRVDPRHENIRDGRNVIDPSLGRIKAHDCLMVINYKPRPGYSNNFPRIRLQFRQKMNNSMTRHRPAAHLAPTRVVLRCAILEQ